MQSKIVLISGITSGIGRSTAEILLKEGFNVAGFAPNQIKCRQLQSNFASQYGNDRCLVIPGDVTNEQKLQSIVGITLKKFKRIDVLINNAGFGLFTSGDSIKKKDFEAMIQVNIVGLAMLTKAVLPVMKKQKSGQVINLASIAGRVGTPKGEFYNATKFAVMGYSDGLRKELKDFGIKVGTVCPGMVKTNFFTKKEYARRMKELWNGVEPTMLSPEDVARTVSFICMQPLTSDIQDILIMPF